MRTKLTAATACAASAALLTVPAPADASVWRGKTEQGRKVLVRTGADGLVNLVTIRFRSRCRHGRGYRHHTDFIPPLDVVTGLTFRDGGRYRTRLNDGYRARIRVRVRGRISADLLRWRGSYRMRAAIRRNGRRVDTCTLRGLRWRARLRR